MIFLYLKGIYIKYNIFFYKKNKDLKYRIEIRIAENRSYSTPTQLLPLHQGLLTPRT